MRLLIAYSGWPQRSLISSDSEFSTHYILSSTIIAGQQWPESGTIRFYFKFINIIEEGLYFFNLFNGCRFYSCFLLPIILFRYRPATLWCLSDINICRYGVSLGQLSIIRMFISLFNNSTLIRCSSKQSSRFVFDPLTLATIIMTPCCICVEWPSVEYYIERTFINSPTTTTIDFVVFHYTGFCFSTVNSIGAGGPPCIGLLCYCISIQFQLALTMSTSTWTKQPPTDWL